MSIWCMNFVGNCLRNPKNTVSKPKIMNFGGKIQVFLKKFEILKIFLRFFDILSQNKWKNNEHHQHFWCSWKKNASQIFEARLDQILRVFFLVGSFKDFSPFRDRADPASIEKKSDPRFEFYGKFPIRYTYFKNFRR